MNAILPQETEFTSQILAQAHAVAAKPYRGRGGFRSSSTSTTSTPTPKSQQKILDPALYPWQLQAWESSSSFNAFQIYLSLGPERSLAAVAQHLARGRVGAAERQQNRPPCVSGHLNEWCSQNLWSRRAAAFDAHLANLRFKAYEDHVVEMSKRQVADAVEFQAVAREAMQRLLEKGQLPTRWDEILKLWTAGAAAEREALGIAVPEPPQQTTSFNFGNLSTAELQQFVALHGKLTQ